MEYSMKIYTIDFENGRTEWCVEYPDLQGCVGGGDTLQEAIEDAELSKRIYLDYLKENGINVPKPTEEKDLPSGKIALRVAKTTHKTLIENAKKEGISLNSYIQTAINEKIGRDQEFDRVLNAINDLKESVKLINENNVMFVKTPLWSSKKTRKLNFKNIANFIA
ncbi:toxin-antitoxin system HicB family antitoxin [Floccifex sp.]|uniref:toxin-antitoxin system HicB family antitoxin n=1 Tax=Floccifex sp. TaxID=2815810 RepID=UPI003EFFD930